MTIMKAADGWLFLDYALSPPSLCSRQQPDLQLRLRRHVRQSVLAAATSSHV